MLKRVQHDSISFIISIISNLILYNLFTGDILNEILDKINDICQAFDYPSAADEELEAEYVRLFINDFDEEIVSLFAASYIKDIPVNQVILHLKQLYESASLNIIPELGLREDHIVICLDFLYFLIEANVEKKLIGNFAYNFIFPFLEVPILIKDKTDNKFYIQAADKLDCFLVFLENWLMEREH